MLCAAPLATAANVAFGPAGIVAAAAAAVTRLRGEVEFTVGGPAGAALADGIVLPTSAKLSVDLRKIPTLSQWGLIGFGVLLLAAMFVTIHRRGLPT